jgi:peptidoglycan biosynthesis protein MviN/MurJ (putative lipid II flippase)
MAAIALIFNLGLNLFLIPRYQHVGAAFVTSLTELLLLCLSCIFLPRRLLPIGSLGVGAKALVASLVMALVVWQLLALNIFALLPIAMLIYLAAATLLGTIPREDMKSLFTAVRQKAQRSSPASHESQQEIEPQLQLQLQLQELQLVKVNTVWMVEP